MASEVQVWPAEGGWFLVVDREWFLVVWVRGFAWLRVVKGLGAEEPWDNEKAVEF